MKVLAGDIGGTHARLALFEREEDGSLSLLEGRRYESPAYPGLVPIVREFLETTGTRPGAACFGVACPIQEGVCRLTNLDWEIDTRTFGRDVGIPDARLINDFDAVGYGLLLLEADDVEILQAGRPKSRAPMAVIGAGTGLGEGYLTWHHGRYHVHASEGGHVDFGPRTPLEADLAAHLRERYGRVSYERIVSGPGLLNIYEFLRDAGYAGESEEVRRELEAGRGSIVISERGRARTDELSRKALEIFVSAFGAQAGNLALTVQAEGGVWVAGGIAPDLLDELRAGPFLESFRAKGRMADLMERIPVRVVLEEKVGLLGAASAAVREDPAPKRLDR